MRVISELNEKRAQCIKLEWPMMKNHPLLLELMSGCKKKNYFIFSKQLIQYLFMFSIYSFPVKIFRLKKKITEIVDTIPLRHLLIKKTKLFNLTLTPIIMDGFSSLAIPI
jgi:hypothetical protein